MKKCEGVQSDLLSPDSVPLQKLRRNSRLGVASRRHPLDNRRRSGEVQAQPARLLLLLSNANLGLNLIFPAKFPYFLYGIIEFRKEAHQVGLAMRQPQFFADSPAVGFSGLI